MTRADARNEIYRYLLALDASASRAVENLTHVKFTTTNEYQYVVTRWIVDGAQVKEIYAAKVTVVMEYLEDVGYFRIYHMDGTA